MEQCSACMCLERSSQNTQSKNRELSGGQVHNCCSWRLGVNTSVTHGQVVLTHSQQAMLPPCSARLWRGNKSNRNISCALGTQFRLEARRTPPSELQVPAELPPHCSMRLPRNKQEKHPQDIPPPWALTLSGLPSPLLGPE